MPIFATHDIFTELVVLLLVAAVAGTAAIRLRQPLIIGFIAVGILAGPSGINWIKSVDQIQALGEMGLALLLFVVGLRLDLHLIRSMGAVALVAGFGQVVFTAIVGFLLAYACGMSPIVATYAAIALTFSSTIIIVKLLSDKHETDSLHGRILLGILIVQDLVAVLAMIVLSTLGSTTVHPPLWQALMIMGKGTALLAGMWVATFLLLPRLLPLLARSTELLMLFGIAWALILAYIGDSLGFGKEVGAFLAGVSLASTEYRDIIGAKLVSLRDFLLLFFFIELGSRLDMSSLGGGLTISLVFALFVLVGKPLLVMIVLGLMGYRKRTSFMTGMHMGQISEFSLILMAMGATTGQLDARAVGIITLVGLITIGFSSYLIQYSRVFYERLSPYLGIFERNVRHREDRVTDAGQSEVYAEIVLFGIGGYGSGIAEQLQERGRTVLGVDFDPQAIEAWHARGWPAVFGDAEDPDFAASLPLGSARWVVSAIRDPQINMALASAVRHAGFTGNMAFTARDRADGESVIALHAGLLLVPFEDAAVQAVDLLFLTEEQIARETMDKLIDTISGHYVVCGFGRMGQQIVKDFRRQGMPYVVVEDNPQQLPKLKEETVPHVIGKASDDEILLRAGISRAKGVIAVASTDEENVFIVLTARGLNPSLFIVARSIMEENEDKLLRAGANRVMSPYILGGRRMAAAVTKPGVMDFLDLVIHSENFTTEIGNVAVPAGSPYDGQAIREIALWQACQVTILAVRRAGDVLHANPGPDFVIHADDVLIAMGTLEQIDAAQRYVSAPGEPSKVAPAVRNPAR